MCICDVSLILHFPRQSRRPLIIGFHLLFVECKRLLYWLVYVLNVEVNDDDGDDVEGSPTSAIELKVEGEQGGGKGSWRVWDGVATNAQRSVTYSRAGYYWVTRL